MSDKSCLLALHHLVRWTTPPLCFARQQVHKKSWKLSRNLYYSEKCDMYILQLMKLAFHCVRTCGKFPLFRSINLFSYKVVVWPFCFYCKRHLLQRAWSKVSNRF